MMPLRQIDVAIHPVPGRQQVISVPKRLSGFVADRPKATAALTSISLVKIERVLCEAAGITFEDDAADGSSATPGR